MGLLLSVLVVCVSILEVLDCIYHIRVGYLGSFSSWRRRINNAGKADVGETSSAAASASAAPPERDVTPPRSRTTSPTPAIRAGPGDDKQPANDATTAAEAASLLQTSSANGHSSRGLHPDGTTPKSAVFSTISEESSKTSTSKSGLQSSLKSEPKENLSPASAITDDPIVGFHPSRNGPAFKKPARLAASTDRPVRIRSNPGSPEPWSRKSFPERALSPSISRAGLSLGSSFSSTPSEPTTPKRSKMDISWPTFVPTHIVHRPIGSLGQMDPSFSMEVDEGEGIRVVKVHRLSPIESSANLLKDFQGALDPHEAYRELQKFLEQLNLDSGGREYSDDEDEDEEPFLNEEYGIDRLFFESPEMDDSPKPGEEYKALQDYLDFLNEHADDPEVYQKWKKTRPSIDSGRRASIIVRPTNPNAEYLALQQFLKVLKLQESNPEQPIVKNWLERQQAQSESSVESDDNSPEHQCEQVQERVNLSECAIESTEPPFVDPAAVRRTLEAAIVVSSDEDDDEEVAALSRLAELRSDTAEMSRLDGKLEVNRARSRSPSPQPKPEASPRPPSGTPRPQGSPEVGAKASSPKPAPGEPFWVRWPCGGQGLRSGYWHCLTHFACKDYGVVWIILGK